MRSSPGRRAGHGVPRTSVSTRAMTTGTPKRRCAIAVSSPTFGGAARTPSWGESTAGRVGGSSSRTLSWQNRFRGLLVRWERRGENYLAMLQLVCGLIAFQQAGGF